MPAAATQKQFEIQPPDLHVENNTHIESNGPFSTDNTKDRTAAPWRALLFFTTKANIPVLVTGVLISIIAGAISPVQSFVIGKVFDRLTSYAAGTLSKDEFKQQENKFVTYLLILAGIAWITFFFDLVLWIAFGELQAKSARDRLFHGLLEKDIEWYDMRKDGISALLPRLQARIRELQLSTSQPLGVLIRAMSSAILSLTLAFVLSWKLTLVTISTVPLIIGVVAWVGGGMQRAFDVQAQHLSAARKVVTSALSGIETVKCFNAQRTEKQQYTDWVVQAANSYYRAANANAIQLALMVLLASSMFVQGFYFGSLLIARGEASTADVITTFLSAISAFQSINAVLPQLIVLERGRVAGSSLRGVMAEVQQQSGPKPYENLLRPGHCYGEIEIRDITFSYPSNPQQTTVHKLSLFITSGQMTYIIGKSGSGKSTIGQLLMRFYPSFHGHIFLDGVDLQAIDVDWLRSNVTLVQQSSLLFNDTVLRNIAFGKRNSESVTKEEITKAVEFALLQSTISDMPNGLETPIGYKGSTLSGGQRQRMALARARLRDTPIVILDECTSALDHISRSLMMEAIREWRRGKTTIVITHDISQILPDDYVYILEHGRLAQEGYRKYIERLEDTPFQAFLPTELRSSQYSFARYKDVNFGSPISGDSPPYAGTKRTGQVNDPLSACLDVAERKRATFLPRITRGNRPFPSNPPSFTAGASSCLSNLSPASNHKHKRKTQDMSQLVDRAGRLAVGARKAPDDIQRRRVKGEVPALPSRGAANHKKISKLTHYDHADSDGEVPRSRSLRWIYSTLWPNIDLKRKLVFVLGWFCSTIHAVSSPAFSFVLSKLLRLFSIPGGDNKKALTFSMIILGISFVDAFSTYTYHFSFEYVGQRWVDSLRSEAMERILDQPRDFFDAEENAVSRLSGSLDRDAEEMRNLLGRFLALMWIVLVTLAVSIVWAMANQPKMTAIALATAPYIFGVTKAYAMVSGKWERLCNDCAEDSAAIFTEVFTNIKTVRALTLEPHFTKKYTNATNRALALGFRRAIFAGFFYGLSDSAGNFSLALIFYAGTRLVASGARVNHIVQVFAMLIFAITNVAAILGYIPQIGSSKDMASRLLRLAHLPKDSHERMGEVRILGVGDILFNKVQFSYPSRPEQTVLKNFNLLIQLGMCTAIVGGSGSGKSTIANLLLKLYTTPNELTGIRGKVGNLTLAHRDIKRIDTNSLRCLIIPVSQTPTILPATVYENIIYGLSIHSPYNDHSSIVTAAQQACIHDFIVTLPQGYNTLIGEGGIGLSGGQAQRIAIARALVRKPAVLILDEATSALDVESANMVRHTIENLVTNSNEREAMTIIIITHSREMMEIAEKVVVLDQGKVVEEGDFEDLLQRNGALTNLLSGGEWTGENVYP